MPVCERCGSGGVGMAVSHGHGAGMCPGLQEQSLELDNCKVCLRSPTAVCYCCLHKVEE